MRFHTIDYYWCDCCGELCGMTLKQLRNRQKVGFVQIKSRSKLPLYKLQSHPEVVWCTWDFSDQRNSHSHGHAGYCKLCFEARYKSSPDLLAYHIIRNSKIIFRKCIQTYEKMNCCVE